MLLTAILVVIILALIYYFVTEKKQISEWKETRVQPMTAIPERKAPEEIIKESKELQLKADKKQVGKTKKKTKSKKSKKAIKSIQKETDINKEKTETDKKIEMAESSPETIKAVAAIRNIIPQIAPNVATEEITEAAIKIRREDSEEKKRKVKSKSKSKKGREMEKEMSVKQDMMSTEKSETELRTEETPFQMQNIAQYMEEKNIMGQVVEQRDIKQLTKVAEKIKKTDSKKRKSKSAKRSKSTKTKKEETEMMVEKDTSSRKHKSKKEHEIMQWTQEVRAEATESNRLIDGMCGTRLSEKEKKAAERIGEQESTKEKKKSKNKSKSNKSKKGETKVTVKQHMKKQTHQTENTVMKPPTTTEITEAVSDEKVIVEPNAVEKKPDEFINEVQEIQKKDSKKTKKKSKKRSKLKKSKKTDEHTAANTALCTEMPETEIMSPKITLANEVTAIHVDQPIIVPSIAEEAVAKPVIKEEPK
ncbi:hypothetical protein T03_2880, partial [Trichinella britovi]